MEGNSTQQTGGGMLNFLNATQGVRRQLSQRNAKPVQQTSSRQNYAPAGRANATNAYPNLKNLGAITTRYGESTKFEKMHPGIDVANKIGTPLNAFSGGTVVKAESGHRQGDKAFGNRVVIKDDNGKEWSYGHLNDVYVKPGQRVEKGQNFGSMGNTGQSYSNNGGTGSHLDLRIFNTYTRLHENPLDLIS